MLSFSQSRLCLRCLASGSRLQGGGKRWWRKAGRASCLAGALAVVSWTLLPHAFRIPEGLQSGIFTSPRLLDRHGALLDEFPRGDFFRHHPVSLEDIPQGLLDATLAAEDKRFFRHDGMDYLAIARATRDFVREGRVISGASTVTQQLVKISSPPARRHLPTKFREGLTARHLEHRWTKDEILTAYFNRLDYGNHRQGCREAARFYFRKPLADCS